MSTKHLLDNEYRLYFILYLFNILSSWSDLTNFDR